MFREPLRINGNELRKVVKATVNEYLDKMTADAMRSLGSIDNPSELARQTSRYLRRDLFNPKQGESAKIQKNKWLVHVTTPDAGMRIMREGFRSSVTDLNFRATQDSEESKEMAEKGLCFACELEDSDTWRSIIEQAKDFGDDWCCVIFQANGFNAFSCFGDKNEVVFRADSAHNFMLLVPMTSEESARYLEYNRDRFDFLRYRDFEGVKLIGRNGKTLLRGDAEELFDTRVPFAQRIQSNGVVTPQQKMGTWLDNNAVQYRNRFGNKNS